MGSSKGNPAGTALGEADTFVTASSYALRVTGRSSTSSMPGISSSERAALVSGVSSLKRTSYQRWSPASRVRFSNRPAWGKVRSMVTLPRMAAALVGIISTASAPPSSIIPARLSSIKTRTCPCSKSVEGYSPSGVCTIFSILVPSVAQPVMATAASRERRGVLNLIIVPVRRRSRRA